MKKIYIQPEIWVEELKAESPLLANSITNVIGKSGSETIFGYGGGDLDLGFRPEYLLVFCGRFLRVLFGRASASVFILK